MKSPTKTHAVQAVSNPTTKSSHDAAASEGKPDNVVPLRQPRAADADASDTASSDAVTLPPGQVPAVVAAAAPAGAAKGDDEVMSQPPPAAKVDDPKAKWARLMGP